MEKISGFQSITHINGLKTKEVAHRSFGLDLVRAMAILLVLAAHFGQRYFVLLGFWGVELFFGLSGFLIGEILWKSFSGVTSWKMNLVVNFWSRRWWRTLPNYYLFFAVMMVFHYFNDGSLPSISYLLQFLWFGQYLLSHNDGFYVVSWSLCIEEWFYILFPMFLYTFNRLGFKKTKSFILSLLIIFSASALIREILIRNYHEIDLREITFARLDAIACGVLIAFLLCIYKISNSLRLIAFCIGILLLIISGITAVNYGYDYIKGSITSLIIVPFGFSLVLPLITLIRVPKYKFVFISTSIEKISLWSYSIYLSHVPIMWITYYLLNNYRDTLYGNLFSKMMSFILTIGVSALLYKFYELPFTKRRPPQLVNDLT